MSLTGPHALAYRGFYKAMLRILFLLSITHTLTACHIGYIVKSAYHQARMLRSGVEIEKVLNNPEVDQKIKDKLRLAQEAKIFAETHLQLEETDNYSSYVQLNRPYVTYVVSAAPKNELKYYKWYFPIVGHVPYKGYFIEADANEEAEDLEEQNYDVFVRGVSAFSTLGWFEDPVLSSMLRYSDYDLVNTIIHETVHATLYISDNANFNERLATYLGDLGTELFYKQKGEDGKKVLENVKKDNHDQRVFSEFISRQIKQLERWYQENKSNPNLLEHREQQFAQIKKHFKTETLPKMQSSRYNKFAEIELNNAKLLGYKLYMNDLSDFEKLTQIFNNDFTKILAYCKSLEDKKSPEAELRDFTQKRGK